MKDSECAERAMTNLNGVDLAGRPMKVNNVTERDTAAMESLDGEDTDIGVGMTPAARAQLMAKLSDGHNAGLAVPQMGGLPATVPTASSCFMLANMFDATRCVWVWVWVGGCVGGWICVCVWVGVQGIGNISTFVTSQGSP